MTYSTFSEHAPTGAASNGKQVVSPNQYSSQGHTIGFPEKFSVYVTKQAEEDGSFSVVETHEASELVGSRLYLYHRPMVSAAGVVTTITPSSGSIDGSLTNAKQGYCVFSVNPTGTFTVSYTAVPDCLTQATINNLQDDVMAIEQVLGPTNLTGWPGLRNLTYGIFDKPGAAYATGVAQNAIFLPHLGRDIRIGSTDDPALVPSLGNGYDITLGYQTDRVILDVTGFQVTNTAGSTPVRIDLGTKTGDFIAFKGQLSGEFPVTIGGPSFPGFSGSRTSAYLLSGGTGFYDNALLRVHGDVAVMGNVHSVGNFVLTINTGQSAHIEGDLQIRDELSIFGMTHLEGPAETNDITVRQNLTLVGDLLAADLRGSGGAGQTLVDGLDPSEIARSYRPVTQRRIPNSVISGPRKQGYIAPKVDVWGQQYHFTASSEKLCGDVFAITGSLNANAGPSGAHPNILQVLLTCPVVSGSYGSMGTYGGEWSPGLMDPGMLWVESTDGTTSGWRAPIYGYTVEATSGHYITRLNVFTPQGSYPSMTGGSAVRLYVPGTLPYDFISAAGGTSPTATIGGTANEPLWIAFEDTVRVHESTSSVSLTTALDYSVSGLGATPTGIAYVFASTQAEDVELPPTYLARAIPYRMPGETILGEVVATKSGANWNIREVTSYRAGGTYDSAWIPITQGFTGAFSGRMTPYMPVAGSAAKVYFNHQLGADVDLTNTSIDLYLAATGNVDPMTLWPNQNCTTVRSFQGRDYRHGAGLSGAFVKIPLNSADTTRDASVFYMDGKVIGVELDGTLASQISVSAPNFQYLRLVMRRDA